MRAAIASAIVAAGISSASAAQGPCDIFGSAGTPCVAAHSTVRALYGDYNGRLYQVNRTSDGRTLDIGVVTAGGAANSAAQDQFCGQNACTISAIYDQSPSGNHLLPGPPGGAIPHPDKPVNATRHKISLNGAPVYGAYFEGGMGYRIDNTVGVARDNDPETLYMVTSARNTNGGCCFDYGNAESDNHDDGAGTMEAVFFGTTTIWGHGSGAGPWVMADLENGLWAGDQRVNNNNKPLTQDFVTAMVKGGTNGFALKGGDATQGGLQLMWDGPRPAGYQPMKKQGSIILGIGGDNSNGSTGIFYEGVMTTGYSTDAADNAVQANIAAAGYGK